MKRRFGVMTMVIAITAIIILILFFSLKNLEKSFTIGSVKDLGGAVQALVFVALELFGIIFLLIILHVYFYTHRTRRFTFEGFVAETKESSAEKIAVNLSKLAREELIKQFGIIYEELRLCLIRYEKEDYNYNEENLITQQYKQEAPYKGTDLSADFRPFGEHQHTLNINFVISTIEQFVQLAPEYVILRRKTFGEITSQSIGESVPQPFKPLVKFIDALVPSNTIRAVAYLQWKGNSTAMIPSEQENSLHPYGPAGITLELEDLSEQRRGTIHTLWQPLSKNTNPGKRPEDSSLGYYTELLPPVMRWLVLLFWEFKLLESQKMFGKRSIRKGQAEFFYILGILYLYSAEQFKDHREFFYQKSLEHLQRSAQTNQRWFLPNWRSGFVYSLLLDEVPVKNKSDKYIEDGMKVLDKALQQAHEKKEEQDIQNNIRSLQLLLKSFDPTISLQEQEKDFQDLITYNQPIYFDSTPEESGTYSYNLACWCAKMVQKTQKNVKKQKWLNFARRYLAYGLARSRRLCLKVESDPKLQAIPLNDRMKLKKKLQARYDEEKEIGLPNEDRLAYLQGDAFERTMDLILDEVGWKDAQSRR